MDVSDPSAEFWLGIAMDGQQDSSSHSWQDETLQSSEVVDNPIYLFGQFASAVHSDTLNNIQPRSKVIESYYAVHSEMLIANHSSQDLCKIYASRHRP
jgi:hypothetical protein